jgi:hypothetical protein
VAKSARGVPRWEICRCPSRDSLSGPLPRGGLVSCSVSLVGLPKRTAQRHTNSSRQIPVDPTRPFFLASSTHVRNLGNERVVRVRVGQHRTDRQQHYARRIQDIHLRQPHDRTPSSPSPRARLQLTLADGQSWTPLIPQDIQTDRTVRVDIGVIDSGGKVDLGRLEGVVCTTIHTVISAFRTASFSDKQGSNSPVGKCKFKKNTPPA